MTNHFLPRLVCPNCKLYNELNEAQCRRCGSSLNAKRSVTSASSKKAFSLGGTVTRVSLLALFFIVSWYTSLMTTSTPLNVEQRHVVDRAINILQQKGFTTEAALLRRVTLFRSTDHWWNQRFGHPQAYAATNFPFEVMTLYPEFFTKTVDDTERAVILLHESYHLCGQGEETAYAEVWREKERLGYTIGRYNKTRVWSNMYDDTLTYAPQLFTCGATGKEDCLTAKGEILNPSTRFMLASIQRQQQQDNQRQNNDDPHHTQFLFANPKRHKQIEAENAEI